MKRFAVIDLGTNTFHVLIAGRKSEHDFIEIYRERIYVRLAHEGIDILSKSALKRAIDAMKKIKQIVGLFEAIEVRAFATAAFRTASNADILIRRIKREFHIDVEIISGDEEARLIYEGVKYGGALERKDNLIMDIGGGSVEFIIGDQEKIQWSTSLPIGASLLKNKFQQEEPISKFDECALRLNIKKALLPLQNEMAKKTFHTLIGSSGTFDVLAFALNTVEKRNKCQVILASDFHAFRKEIQRLDLEDRIAHPNIPEKRADLIVVAFILLDEVLKLNPEFKEIIASPFALKEGMIMDMISAYLV